MARNRSAKHGTALDKHDPMEERVGGQVESRQDARFASVQWVGKPWTVSGGSTNVTCSRYGRGDGLEQGLPYRRRGVERRGGPRGRQHRLDTRCHRNRAGEQTDVGHLDEAGPAGGTPWLYRYRRRNDVAVMGFILLPYSPLRHLGGVLGCRLVLILTDRGAVCFK